MHSRRAKSASHLSALVTVQFFGENRGFLYPGNLEVRWVAMHNGGGVVFWPSCCWGHTVVCCLLWWSWKHVIVRESSPSTSSNYIPGSLKKNTLRRLDSLSYSENVFYTINFFLGSNWFSGSPGTHWRRGKINTLYSGLYHMHDIRWPQLTSWSCFTLAVICVVLPHAVLCVLFVGAQGAARGSGRWVPSAFVSAWAGFPSFLPLLSFYIVLGFLCWLQRHTSHSTRPHSMPGHLSRIPPLQDSIWIRNNLTVPLTFMLGGRLHF